MIKFSVIIPVYNTEKYLRQCLDSLFAYKGDDLEVIALDDGSTDGSLALLKSYPDPRLKVFHHENMGVFKTWKLGVGHSRGEYIVFVDSDDYVSEYLFPSLHQALAGKEGGYDLIQYGYTVFGDKRKQTAEEPYPQFSEGEYFGEALQTYKRTSVLQNLSPERYATARARWGKAFRAEKLKQLLPRLMDRVEMFEDDSAVIPYLTEMQSLYLLRKPLYFYRIGRAGSVCNSPEKLEAQFHDAGAVTAFLARPEWGISADALDCFCEYYHTFVLWLAILAQKDDLAGRIADDSRFAALLKRKKGFKAYLLRKKRFRTYRFLKKIRNLLTGRY